MTLLTKNVFIDTQFFMAAELDFSSGSISSFEELCQKGELVHITNTVVIQEIKKKILESIKEGLKGIENFQKRAGFLRSDKELSKQVFTILSEEKLNEKGVADLEAFLKATRARILDMKKIDPDEILDMFFKQKRPFGAAKKQNEFRDAFSLISLRQELKEGESIYVVSNDPDHKAFCVSNDRFISVENLNSLLDICYKHIEAKRAAFIEKFLKENKETIIQELKSQLESADGYNVSTWEDAELEKFSVTEIGEFEPEITHIKDESCRVNFDVMVKFLATVTGPDAVNGHYDKEDGVLYTFDNVEREEEEEHDFSVELDVGFESDEGEFINPQFDLTVEGLHKGIEFGVEETPWEDPRM